MKLRELSQKELKTITGGAIPLAVAWGIVKIVGAISASAYATGYAVGKCKAHLENNSYEKNN